MSDPLDLAAARIQKRFDTRQNHHEEARHVSASSLVRMTAEEHARILDAKANGTYVDDSPAYNSFYGNAIADSALAEWPYREQQAIHPIGIEDWHIVSHNDAMDAFDGGVVVAEVKAHGEWSPRKQEVARRQATLNLAMAWRMWKDYEASVTNAGYLAFEIADYVADGPKLRHFCWRLGMRPAGVLVAICEPPGMGITGRLASFPVTEEELDHLLDFYTRKARAIVEAFVKRDMSIARAWDEGDGLVEFARDLDEMFASPQEMVPLVEAYATARENADAWDKEKKRLGVEIEVAMRDANLKSCEAAGYRVHITRRQNPDRANVEMVRRMLPEAIVSGGESVFPTVKKLRGATNE